MISQNLISGFADVWVRMNRIYHLHVLVVVRQRQYRPADFPEWRTEILSAMGGDKDQAFIRIKVKGERDFTFCDAQQCIDHRITSNKYIGLANTFFKQVVAGALRRGEMPLRQSCR